MLLLLIGSAQAHVPHDTIAALAAPVDLADDHRWIAVSDPGVYMIMASDDGGSRWALVGGEPLQDALTDAAMLTSGTYVLLGEDRYWWSDDGESWTAEATPTATQLIDGLADTLLMAGDDGIWAGPVGGPFEQELEGDIVAFGAGGMAVGGDGQIYRREFEAWTALGAPLEGASATAEGTAGTFMGTSEGAVYRLDGADWVECGTLPAVEVPEIVNIAVTATQVWVATGSRAPFLSTDRCATWTDRNVGYDTIFGGDGAAEAIGDAWPVFVASGPKVVVGGWAGLFTSSDGGSSWVDHPVLPPDYTRGLAFGADFATTRRVYLGPYSSGPVVIEEGGLSYTANGLGLHDYNVQRIEVADSSPNTVYTIVGHAGFISTDGGVSWEEYRESTGKIIAWESPDHVWSIEPGGVVYETFDGGKTWTSLADLVVALDGSSTKGAELIDGRPCVSASEPSRIVCDNDGVWTELFVGTDAGTVTSPADFHGRILMGDADGIHFSDDDGDTWTVVTPAPGDGVVELVVADDGTLFAATRSALLLRSLDGGETWTPLGDRLTAYVQALATRPDFATFPDLLVATNDGTWLVHRDDPPVRWAAYQRVDAHSALSTCTGCQSLREDLTAGLGTVIPLYEGGRVRAWLRGERIRILGDSTGSGLLYIDDVEVASFGVAEDVLADVEVEPGWHEVVVVAVTEDVAIDAFEGYTASATLSFVPDPDTGDPGDGGSTDGGSTDGGSTDGGSTDGGSTDGGSTDGGSTDGGGDDTGEAGKERCGCGGGGVSALALLPLIPVLLRRRKRPDQDTTPSR